MHQTRRWFPWLAIAAFFAVGPVLFAEKPSAPPIPDPIFGPETDRPGLFVKQTVVPQQPAEDPLVRELVAILNETKTADTFVVTAMTLMETGADLRPIIPTLIRNAERLKLLDEEVRRSPDAIGSNRRIALLAKIIDGFLQKPGAPARQSLLKKKEPIGVVGTVIGAGVGTLNGGLIPLEPTPDLKVGRIQPVPVRQPDLLPNLPQTPPPPMAEPTASDPLQRPTLIEK